MAVSYTTEEAATSGAGGDSILGAYYTRIIIGSYSRPEPFASSEFKNTTIINLPLPSELSDNTSVGYNTINLESVGDMINGQENAEAIALRNASALASTGKTFITNIFGAAAGAVGGNIAQKIIQGATGSVMAAALPSDQISSAVQQRAGYAPNPNASVAFQGPELRSFSYTWTVYPKNKDESDKVKQLVEILKQNALPATHSSGASAILNYPSMCQLNFFPWDSGGSGPWYWAGKSIIKYKKCVMTAVNVKYNQFGPPAFFEGTQAPVTVSITIGFKELEYMLSEDWSGKSGIAIFKDTAPTVEQVQTNIVQSETAQYKLSATHFAKDQRVLTIVEQQEYVKTGKLPNDYAKKNVDIFGSSTFTSVNTIKQYVGK